MISSSRTEFTDTDELAVKPAPKVASMTRAAEAMNSSLRTRL